MKKAIIYTSIFSAVSASTVRLVGSPTPSFILDHPIRPTAVRAHLPSPPCNGVERKSENPAIIVGLL